VLVREWGKRNAPMITRFSPSYRSTAVQMGCVLNTQISLLIPITAMFVTMRLLLLLLLLLLFCTSAGGALSRSGPPPQGARSDLVRVPPPSLGRDLAGLLASGAGTDFEFVVEGQPLRAHRVILQASARVFNTQRATSTCRTRRPAPPISTPYVSVHIAIHNVPRPHVALVGPLPLLPLAGQ
jgi:hypothetical protein